MDIHDFDFPLPPERIARFPASRREDSRLMVVDRAKGSIEHRHFRDLPGLLEPEDFLVINDSRVVAGKLFGDIDKRSVEVTVVKKLASRRVEVLARPARRLRPGTVVSFGKAGEGRVVKDCGRGRRWIEFNRDLEQVFQAGFAPLPPYIKRKAPEASRHRDLDLSRYQTVYSGGGFSIAAPTAGLHFSEQLISRIEQRHPVFRIRLDVGETTFRKIEVQDIREHAMGKETVYIDQSTGCTIDRLKLNRRLVAVGTTTVRALETYARLARRPSRFESEIYIYPGFEFRLVNKLITNFHLPRSSLFILVCAFAGLDLMQTAYRMAIKEGYRFFSYGDAMMVI